MLHSVPTAAMREKPTLTATEPIERGRLRDAQNTTVPPYVAAIFECAGLRSLTYTTDKRALLILMRWNCTYAKEASCLTVVRIAHRPVPEIVLRGVKVLEALAAADRIEKAVRDEVAL